MKQLSEITDFTDVVEFGRQFTDSRWVRDCRACKSLNKTLETNFRAVFREETYYKSRQWSADDISWDSEEFYVVTASGKILEFMNSEWGGVGKPSK